MDPISIALEHDDRRLWLSEGRHGPQLQFQDGPTWSARFPCALEALQLVALGTIQKVELRDVEETELLRIGWRGGFIAEWETQERTLRESIDMREFLDAVKAIS